MVNLWFIYISIPYGAIKSNIPHMRVAITSLISIPYGAIKSGVFY